MANYQALKNKMLQYGLNIVRLGSGDELFGSSYTWHNGDAVQWFLDNSDFVVVADRDHTINAGTSSKPVTQAMWDAIDAHLEEMAVRWASYGDRLWLEPINEYSGDSEADGGPFRQAMQRVIDTFRGKGLSNWLVFNKMQQPWTECILSDVLGKTYVGYHYYMNDATSTNDYGLSRFNDLYNGHVITGLPIFGSEEGADYNEADNDGDGIIDSYTQAKVDAVSRYLQLCADAGFHNVVWMNHELNNIDDYELFGLVFPSMSSIPLPFHDDFTDPTLPNWTKRSGTWSVTL